MNLSCAGAPSDAALSVVLCTYNGARFLGEQLRSIAEQTRLPDELVICDDASTDGTVPILKSFAQRAPFSVRIVRNDQRLGSTANFDQAIQLARGRAIALCDQDDRWTRAKLERLAGILESNPDIGGVFSDASLMDRCSEAVDGGLFQQHRFNAATQRAFRADPVSVLLKHCIVCGATLMFRASLRRCWSGIPRAWVHDAWLAWMIALNSKLDFTTERLIDYRIHEKQQIGIGKMRSTGPGERAELPRDLYRKVSDQFVELLTHLMASDVRDRERAVVGVRAKIGFLQREAALPKGLAARAFEMARLLPGYMRYSRGIGAIRADALMD